MGAQAVDGDPGHVASLLHALIDGMADAVVAADATGRILLFNGVAEHLFGRQREEVLSRQLFDQLFPPGVGCRLRQRIVGGDEVSQVTRLEAARSEVVDARGERIPVQIAARPIVHDGRHAGVVVIISDVRERLRMVRTLTETQEKLQESDRLALLAELAGTTAHELNQPLTCIMGYAELLRRRLPAGDPNVEATQMIIDQASRMADIVRKIGTIIRYETKPYVGQTQILDLERSTK